MNTPKKTYEKPYIEFVKAEACNRLLNWSAPKDDGPGTGTIEIEAKEDISSWGNLWADVLWED